MRPSLDDDENLLTRLGAEYIGHMSHQGHSVRRMEKDLRAADAVFRRLSYATKQWMDTENEQGRAERVELAHSAPCMRSFGPDFAELTVRKKIARALYVLGDLSGKAYRITCELRRRIAMTNARPRTNGD